MQRQIIISFNFLEDELYKHFVILSHLIYLADYLKLNNSGEKDFTIYISCTIWNQFFRFRAKAKKVP
jgi:hypothetical protein